MTSDLGRTNIPLKLSAAYHATRLGSYALLILGLTLALIVLIIAVIRLVSGPPNSAGAIGPLIVVGLPLGGGLAWLGYWLRRSSDYYRVRLESAAAEISRAAAPRSCIAPAGEHLIHFSRKWSPLETSLRYIGRYDRVLPTYVLLLCVAIAGFGLQPRLHLSDGFFFLIAILFCLLISGWRTWRLWIQWRRFRAARHDLAAQPDDNFRLRCVGLPEDFESFGGFVDVPFEPMTFNASWSSVAFLQPIIKGAAIAVGVIAGAAFLLVVFAIDIKSPLIGLGGAAFAATTAYSITFLLWQTYIEVSPGRLDISWVSMFGLGRPHRISVNLHTARVLVDTRRWRVLLEQPNSDRPRVAFSIVLIPHRMELAYRIFLAAISSHKSDREPAD